MIVCSSLGHDAPRICDMCLTREGRQLKLMPWGGMAHSVSQQQKMANAQGRTIATPSYVAKLLLPSPADRDRAATARKRYLSFCDRRDIWYGSDSGRGEDALRLELCAVGGRGGACIRASSNGCRKELRAARGFAHCSHSSVPPSVGFAR